MPENTKPVTVENGHLVIRIPLMDPVPSSTGKTLLIGQLATGYDATVREPKTGKPIRVSLTAMVKP
jgi:hypothetical protein